MTTKGDVTLVQDVMRNRELQDTLREKDPDHWARLFGEHVEATSSAAPPPVPQQELVQKAAARGSQESSVRLQERRRHRASP